MLIKPNAIKIIGLILPIVSAGLSIATGWVEDKKLDGKIAEKIAEALANNQGES